MPSAPAGLAIEGPRARWRAMDFRIQRSPGEGDPIEKSATEARQGVTGHNVRYVLAISLGAAVLVLACLWLVFFTS